MTTPTPVGFLDFFILEASDYVEQLDSLLHSTGGTAPDAEALQRIARALRGSATMAKLPAFAEVAGGVERVGRALREHALTWDSALGAVVVGSVDDCKVLLRNVRNWSEADDTRARARVNELTAYAAARAPTPLATPTMQGHDSYLATEASNIGAGLELLATRPNDKDAAANVLRRVRALRGIASVKDHPTLADVLEAAEYAAHPLELGEPVLSAERITLLHAAANVLRGVATAIRAGDSQLPAADVARFTEALDALHERQIGAERVLLISELFYDDGGETVVDKSANPPTTPPERFRLEVVSQGEHLLKLVQDARAVHRAGVDTSRVRRELSQALRALRQAAESFGESDVANFVASQNDAALRLDSRALETLEEVATILAQPSAGTASIAERVAAAKRARTSQMTPVAATAVVPPPAPPPAVSALTPVKPVEQIVPAQVTPAAAMLAAASTVATTAVSAASKLGDLLEAGIKGLGSLDRQPLSAPATIAEQPPVPIDVLLYRGRSAIERCVELRDEARRKGAPMDEDALGELFDLLDLALVD